MAGWNGFGTWVRGYNWVQDALAGIKILAARQDAEWTNATNGFNNCLTRDGQAVWTGNQDLGGFQLTNMGSGGVSPTNGATIGDFNTNMSQYNTETTSVAWVSSTSFKVIGTDLTTRYVQGRRVRVTHNTGATTSNATVISSAFAAGDTTVTVLVDNAVSLLSTVTTIQYSIINPTNQANWIGTALTLYTETTATAVTSNTPYLLGGSSVLPTIGVYNDIFGELASGIFSASRLGVYLATIDISMAAISLTLTAPGYINLNSNGSVSNVLIKINAPAGNAAGVFSGSMSFVVKLAAGQIIRAFVNTPTFSAGSMTSSGYGNSLTIRQLY